MKQQIKFGKIGKFGTPKTVATQQVTAERAKTQRRHTKFSTTRTKLLARSHERGQCSKTQEFSSSAWQSSELKLFFVSVTYIIQFSSRIRTETHCNLSYNAGAVYSRLKKKETNRPIVNHSPYTLSDSHRHTNLFKKRY